MNSISKFFDKVRIDSSCKLCHSKNRGNLETLHQPVEQSIDLSFMLSTLSSSIQSSYPPTNSQLEWDGARRRLYHRLILRLLSHDTPALDDDDGDENHEKEENPVPSYQSILVRLNRLTATHRLTSPFLYHLCG